MRLSFRSCVFILLGLLILAACAEIETSPAASTPTPAPTTTAKALPAEKTLRLVEFYSPM